MQELTRSLHSTPRRPCLFRSHAIGVARLSFELDLGRHNFMDATSKHLRSPRAATTILFGCFSLFVWWSYLGMAGVLGRYQNLTSLPSGFRETLSRNTGYPLGEFA